MPRQDVPYGGAICRLKERIAEIWDKLGEKLHSINGVEGDGAGDVKIVSGDAAVVISNDQIGHKIEVGLDKSKLPSDAVQSVNGEIGAVRLDAADIPSDGNSNVQADIAANKAAINKCSDSITSEQTARENADGALQEKINGVQAAVDTEVIARRTGDSALQTAVDGKAAKTEALGTGTMLSLASGTGARRLTLTRQVVSGAVSGQFVTLPAATSTESGLMSAAQASKLATPVVNGTDANSIGLRDANGRMQAADPASGATDKTLVTANWVSQTGDSGPNNILHKNGDETKNGKLTIGNELRLYNADWATIPPIIFVQANLDSTVPPTAYKSLGGGFRISDSNGRVIWEFSAYRDTNGRDVFNITGTACDGSSGWLHFEVGPNNHRKIATNFNKPDNW